MEQLRFLFTIAVLLASVIITIAQYKVLQSFNNSPTKVTTTF